MSGAAEAWVRGFEEGWRAPTGATGLAEHFGPMVDPEVRLIQPQMPLLVGDRIHLRDGLAVERESYTNPTPLLLAVARRPRSWPRFLRVQAMQLRRRGGRPGR